MVSLHAGCNVYSLVVVENSANKGSEHFDEGTPSRVKPSREGPPFAGRRVLHVKEEMNGFVYSSSAFGVTL